MSKLSSKDYHDVQDDVLISRHESKSLWRELLYLTIFACSFVFLFALFEDMNEIAIFSEWPTNILVGLATILAISIIIRTKLGKKESRKLMPLAFGIIAWFIAQIIWTYYQIVIRIEIPYPSVADITWFIGFFFMGIYIFNSFQYWNRKDPIKPSYIIGLCIITSIIVTYLFISSLY